MIHLLVQLFGVSEHPLKNLCIRRCSFGVCSCSMLEDPFNEKTSSFYSFLVVFAVYSCSGLNPLPTTATVLLQMGLCVPADSCTNGRTDLSGSIMS